jgi:hypothetical protein
MIQTASNFVKVEILPVFRPIFEFNLRMLIKYLDETTNKLTAEIALQNLADSHTAFVLSHKLWEEEQNNQFSLSEKEYTTLLLAIEMTTRLFFLERGKQLVEKILTEVNSVNQNNPERIRDSIFPVNHSFLQGERQLPKKHLGAISVFRFAQEWFSPERLAE